MLVNCKGIGSLYDRQAIIPMGGRTAGDPHTLTKDWGDGSMWWRDWGDINAMRNKCVDVLEEEPICTGIL